MGNLQGNEPRPRALPNRVHIPLTEFLLSDGCLVLSISNPIQPQKFSIPQPALSETLRLSPRSGRWVNCPGGLYQVLCVSFVQCGLTSPARIAVCPCRGRCEQRLHRGAPGTSGPRCLCRGCRARPGLGGCPADSAAREDCSERVRAGQEQPFLVSAQLGGADMCRTRTPCADLSRAGLRRD